jgi:MYXO-CTERM domain-containing protein
MLESHNKLLGAAAIGALLSGVAHAQVVQFNFDAGNASPSFTDPGVSVTQAAVGFTPEFTASQFRAPAAEIDASTPVATTDYFGFTVTPTVGGTKLNLTSLTFDIGRVFTGNYPVNWSVFSSVDGFASSIASGSVSTGTGLLTGQNIDLSAPAYQDLTSVEFRVAFGDGNNGANNRILLDDLTLNGSVVPEPHEYAAMAALGLLGFAAWRRLGRA